MLGNVAIGLLLMALLLLGEYWWFRRINRLRCERIVGWIERAFRQRGSIGSVHWDSASCFRVELRFYPRIFRHAFLAVRLQPRPMPWGWLVNRMPGGEETVTFEAELDAHPGFNLAVQKHHWRVRTCRLSPTSLAGWQLRSLDAMVLSTQADCQDRRGPMLDTLLAARSSKFSRIAFRRQTAHLVACAPLRLLAPDESGEEVFAMLEELASSASTSAH